MNKQRFDYSSISSNLSHTWRSAPVLRMLTLLLAFGLTSIASAQTKKPNILVIFGDENVQGVSNATEFIETFKEYPPSQAPASFTVDPEAILKMLQRQQAAMQHD